MLLVVLLVIFLAIPPVYLATLLLAAPVASPAALLTLLRVSLAKYAVASLTKGALALAAPEEVLYAPLRMRNAAP
jgi:hypothetical protein